MTARRFFLDKAEVDCRMRAHAFTDLAANTFGGSNVKKARCLFFFCTAFYRADYFYLHGAFSLAGTAACAFGRVYAHAVQGYFVKKSVKGAERAYVFAKRPVNENGKDDGKRQKKAFPTE